MSDQQSVISAAPEPAGAQELYVSRRCRAGRHDQCLRGLIVYPEGWGNVRIDVPCGCAVEGCPCAAVQE